MSTIMMAAAVTQAVWRVSDDVRSRKRASGIVMNASGAAAAVTSVRTGSRTAGTATNPAMIDVAGWGRGIPRESQTAKQANNGGATAIRSRSAS